MYRQELAREARLIAQGQQLYVADFARRWKRFTAWFGFSG